MNSYDVDPLDVIFKIEDRPEKDLTGLSITEVLDVLGAINEWIYQSYLDSDEQGAPWFGHLKEAGENMEKLKNNLGEAMFEGLW